MPLAKKWLDILDQHAVFLQLDAEDVRNRVHTKKDLDAFLACRTRDEWGLVSSTKEHLLELCRQRLSVFKKTMARKPKSHLLSLLMNNQPPTNGSEPDLIGKESVPLSELKMRLSRLKKPELVGMASRHSAFQKSMARKTKEFLMDFIIKHEIPLDENKAATIPVDENPPTGNHPPVAKTLSRSFLMKQHKKELLEMAQPREGFQPDTHGRTKATLVEFLRGPPPTPPPDKASVPIQVETLSEDNTDMKQPVLEEESGYSPFRIASLLETDDNHEALRSAILRILTRTEPFRHDRDLEQKVGKMLG